MTKKSLLGLLSFLVFLFIACETTEDILTPIEMERSVQVYLEGTEDTFEVHTFNTHVPGPVVFIIGGVHANERAGWMAAQALLDETFERGIIHILPIAQRRTWLLDPPRRVYPGWQDLNRSFPGRPDGSPSEQLAYAIYNAIRATSPDLVIDLHESRFSYTEEGWIGDSLILHLADYSLYVLEVLEQFNALPLQENQTPFTYLNAPPVGSLNRTYSEQFDVPVLTVETNRQAVTTAIDSEQQPLSLRVAQQLALIDIILETFKVSE